MISFEKPGFRLPKPNISIVIPVYRSVECVQVLIDAIAESFALIDRTYEVILIDDCSPDESWTVIENVCRVHSHVVGINLRRNFGQDNAILTGLRFARGEFVVIMDDDLQHHPRDIPSLVAKLEDGDDVVYARFNTKHQSLWKNLGSWLNGKVAEWVIAKPPGIYLSPFKAVRGDVAKLICDYKGPDPYIDGLLLQVTSRINEIVTEHHPRSIGESNYTLMRSLNVWSRHAFSFSVRPLRVVTVFGFLLAALAIALGVIVIMRKLFAPEVFPAATAGWASLMVTILFVGGAQMVFFGILGEYAGRTFLRVNNKPQSSIRAVINAGEYEVSRTDQFGIPIEEQELTGADEFRL